MPHDTAGTAISGTAGFGAVGRRLLAVMAGCGSGC